MQYFVDFVSPGSAETNIGCGGKLDNHLIASCARNIDVKNDYNLFILFKLQSKMSGMFFSDMVQVEVAY